MAENLTYDTIEIGRNYGPWKYPLRDRIARYLEAVENQHPWHHGRSPWGPPVAPPTVIGNAALRFIDSIAAAPAATLHVKQSIETSAALRLDRQPQAYGHFAEKYERRGRRWATFVARWREETGLLIGHTRTTIALPETATTPNDEPSSQGSSQKTPGKREGELTPIVRTLTQAHLDAFSEDSADAIQGHSIQTNHEVAKAAGYPATVAPGMMAADFISELMTSVFGKEWFENATLSLTFLKPVHSGDTITTNGSLASEVAEGAVVRKTYDVWAQNQAGEIVVTGTAGSLVMPATRRV